jgi:acetyl esterase/lipase
MKTWIAPLAAFSLAFATTALAQDRRRPPRPPDPSIEIVRDVTYGVVAGRELRLDIVRPAPRARSAPAVVFVHGGGWRTGDKSNGIRFLTELAKRGYVGATINYRLTGAASFPAQIEDVKCAVRYLRANASSLGIDPDRIGAWGPSAGGHLVSLLATSSDVEAWNVSGGWSGTSSRVSAVVDWYGPANLLTIATQPGACASSFDHGTASAPEGLLLGCAITACPQKAIEASPQTYVSADDPPMLIMHGTRDCVVPVAQSREFHESLRAAGVDSTLMIFEGAGHAGPQFEAAIPDVVAFFDRHLR